MTFSVHFTDLIIYYLYIFNLCFPKYVHLVCTVRPFNCNDKTVYY